MEEYMEDIFLSKRSKKKPKRKPKSSIEGNGYIEDIFFSKRSKLTRKEAKSSIVFTKNHVKELLEDDQGVMARNRINFMIETFRKWGYVRFIPKLNRLLGEIQIYIINNPSAGIEPNRKPKGDGDPLPPFKDEGKYLLMRGFRRISFPEEIFDYPQLEELLIVGDPDFNRSVPLRIPDKFDKLPNLRTLCLNYMVLGPLPESISRLTKLEKFELHHGAIREIPAWIGKLTALKELDLTSQGIISLPDSIGDLPSLQIFTKPRQFR